MREKLFQPVSFESCAAPRGWQLYAQLNHTGGCAVTGRKFAEITAFSASLLIALPLAAPAQAGPAAAMRWSGFYAGVQAGYGAGTTDLTLPGGAGTSVEACDAGSMGIIPLYTAPAGSVFDSPETGNQRYPAAIAALLDLVFDNSIDLYVPQRQAAFDFRGLTPFVANDECIIHGAYALGLSGNYFGGRSGTPPFPPLPPEFPTNFVPSDGSGTIVTTVLPGGADANVWPRTSGITGGVQAGYNFVTDSGLLIGIEGDWSLATIGGSAALGTGSLAADIDWLGSLRARIGLATDTALFYLTGGGAVSGITVTYSTGATTGSGSSASLGWTLGGGVEFALTERLSLRGEYKYFDFGAASYTANGATINSGSSSLNTVTVGLNFRF